MYSSTKCFYRPSVVQWLTQRDERSVIYLVEITLKKELFENVNELGKSWELFLKVLDKLDRSDTGGHVKADVNLDVRSGIN